MANEVTVVEVTRGTPSAGSGSWARLLVILSDTIDEISTILFVVGIAGFAAVMLLGVFFRYVLNDSLAWSDELALVIFCWAIFLAISSGYLHDKHVNLDLLVERLSTRRKRRVAVLADGLSGGYLLSLLISGAQALELAGRAHTDALQWPLSVPYLAIPVATALMLVHWLRRNLACDVGARRWIKIAIGMSFFFLVYLPIGRYVALSGTVKGTVLLVMLFGPMLIGVPVAICLGLLATFYVGIFGDVSFQTGAMQIFYGINILALMAIPLLILAGRLMHSMGIAELIVAFAQALVGRVRGGLGAANIVASFIFGDMSGSAVSDTAAIGSVMIPQMKARGYHADFCAALQGSAGTLGMMAPLAITLLLYATAVNTSVSRLAAATILPAFLIAGSFMAVTLHHARKHNYPREHIAPGEFLPRTWRAMPGMLAVVVVVAGILGGVFTPAEVGTILLLYVLILAVFLYRTARPKLLFEAVVDAGHIAGMTLFMASTSAFVGFVLARDLVSVQIVTLLSQISTDRLVVVALVSLVFIILGMILEPPAMIFGFLPSFLPLLMQAKVDLVYFGVLFCTNMGLGCLIPPVALNLFVSTQLAGVKYEEAVRASIPFIAIMIADLILMALFPRIPLELPHYLFGYPLP